MCHNTDLVRLVLLITGEENCFVCTEPRFIGGFKSPVFLQGQQLMDLEHKLTIAKEELEKTALDKVGKKMIVLIYFFM